MNSKYQTSEIGNELEVENFIAEMIDGRYSGRIQLPIDSPLRNISEKLNSLAAVLESNIKEQDDAQRIAKIGNWTYNLSTNKILWSKELFKLHPVDPNLEPPDFPTLCQMIHPDDRTRFQSLVEKCVVDGTSYHTLHRIVFPDKILWMDAYGQAKKDSSGKIISIYGTAQDVSEQIEREELSRFILDALQIGVWKFNPTDQSLIWDRSMYEIFDAKEEDFTGHFHAWESTLTPEAKNKAVEELEQALNGEKEFDTIFEIQTKNRGRRFISGRGKVIRDNSGKAIMMYGVNIDVTTQKTNNLERERVSKFLEVVLQNIPSMIFAKDCKNDFNFSMLNKAGESILGINSSQFIGKNDYDLFNKDHADTLRASDNETIQTGKPVTAKEVVVNTPSGPKTLKTVKFPIYDEFNNPTYVIGISNDITEELKIKASLDIERTKSFRNAKLASLGEMSAGIAHEINNPLTIITSSANLLEKLKDNPDKFFAKIEMIKKASHRISRIVKGLKKFSRSDLSSQHKNYILQNIISESFIITEAKAKEYTISIFFETTQPLEINCDEIEVEQVIVNLISNSIDAIKNLSERWIRISVSEDSHSVILQIRDSGSGIPKEVRDKLFDPFFTTKNMGEGTGLGLSITKGILDEHDASIIVLENDPNTCFEIRFPKIKEIKREDFSSPKY